MNPFDQKAVSLNQCIMDWQGIRPASYDKNTVDPYTRTRVILMNGTEFEANWFLHQFSRHCDDNDVRRELSLIRRLEQQQQKLISLLKPADETVMEHTIGYEQLAVDLTAALAQRENDEYVKRALDFALLEDFDHLYRYADYMNMESGTKAENLVGRYTEIMPGRPTISEHRYPFDDIKKHIDDKTATIQTKLCVNIITAAEQQTMNYYMNTCGTYPNECGRKLYQEIGMIEEQHVSQYGSLIDTNSTWMECLLMHQYVECYLYYSCMQTETDKKIKKIWEQLFEQELAHLQAAAILLKKTEGKEYQQVIGNGTFPEPLALCSNIDYVRGVLASSVQLTANRESYACIDDLKPDVDFFKYQDTVNKNVNCVTSHTVIDEHIKRFGEDYRFETMPNPVKPLQNRKVDNIDVGRVPGSAKGC
ncbi:MAG: hypothetical protein Q4D04_04850 [Clostridia bacterium]|nr:hypothetical protein [Clostridia bacterium]